MRACVHASVEITFWPGCLTYLEAPVKVRLTYEQNMIGVHSGGVKISSNI